MIFFFGCSRTASKAYQHILNKNTNINISRELHLISGPTSKSLYRVYLKYRFRHKSLNKLCIELETLRNATYWRTKQFNADSFLNYLQERGIKKLNFKLLIRSIISFDASKNEKDIIGAKFPVHIFFYPIFKGLWGFKNAKFIFLAREPKDIVFSQFNKHEIKNRLVRIGMILYVALMFNFTIFYSIFSSKKNMHFIKYEDFKADKRQVIMRMCDFLDQIYNEDMLTVKVFDSLIRNNTADYNLTIVEAFLLKIFTFPWAYLYKSQ